MLQVQVIVLGEGDTLCPAVKSWAAFTAAVIEFSGLSRWGFAIIKIRADAIIQRGPDIYVDVLSMAWRIQLYLIQITARHDWVSTMFLNFLELCYIFLPHKCQGFIKLNLCVLIMRSVTATFISEQISISRTWDVKYFCFYQNKCKLFWNRAQD